MKLKPVLDVVIVGAGTAGLGALREIREHTQDFAIVNDGPWGTMCARVGCMPSKALLQAADDAQHALGFGELGIGHYERSSVDLGAVLARVRRLRDSFVATTRELTDELGECAISGRARLLGPGTVLVNGRELKARSIVVATGSRPTVPAAWKPFADKLLTTDSLFEQRGMPARLAVLGMGGVGLEMAQALARLGLQVTAFDAKTTLAGSSDAIISDTLLDVLKRELAVHLGHEAEVHEAGDALRVKAGPNEVEVDRVLVALGRRQNVDGLGLETLGVNLDEHGMPEVNPSTLQIGDVPVFLCGDAYGEVPLQHEAADEGHVAGANALGAGRKLQRRTPLAITFCDPNFARVGHKLSELDARELVVGQSDFEEQGRARIMLRNVGKVRLYADRARGKLLGAELCAPGGEHLAHYLALAIHRDTSIAELLRAPFYHPSLEEGLRAALVDAARQLPEGDADHVGG